MHVDIDGEYDGGSEDIKWSIIDDETLQGLVDARASRCEQPSYSIPLHVTRIRMILRPPCVRAEELRVTDPYTIGQTNK